MNFILFKKYGKLKVAVLIFFSLIEVISYAQPGNVNENGYNVFYYSNGNKSSEGNLRNGKPDGYWKTYYENGILKTEGNRKNFLLDSVWRFYDDKGVLTTEITYQAGKKSGLQKNYQGNILVSSENFKDNIKEGDEITYRKDGSVKQKISFKNNEKSGSAIEFDTLGNVVTVEEYDNGFLANIQRLNRFDSKGNKEGKWIEYYDNGNIKYEGQYLAGLKHGVFKEYNLDGTLDKIEIFENGVPDSENKITVFIDIRKEYHENGQLKLIGGYHESKKHGVFREYNDTGAIVNSFIYEFGNKIYEGIIDELGVKIGPCKQFYITGEIRAEGAYEKGLKSGDWKYYFADGKTEQKGKYVNDKPNGVWNWYYKSGQIRKEEIYRNGKENGTLTEYDSTGVILTKGDFANGRHEGTWFYNIGDHTEEGNYVDGEREGIWIYKYPNGKTAFEGKYINGLADGKHKYYYENGVTRLEGKYKLGMKTGVWKRFKEDGKIDYTIEYKNGVEVKYDGIRVKEINDITKVNSVDL